MGVVGGAVVLGVLWRPAGVPPTTRAERALVTARGGERAPVIEPAVAISLSDRLAPRLPMPGVPPGWLLKEFAGPVDVELVRDEMPALRLRSRRASYALYRDAAIDVRTYPWLSWWWKVVQLPSGADVRVPGSDDQAAQLYVVFPRWPDPRQRSEVIGYVWDTTAPVGHRAVNGRAPNVRVIVVGSGAAGVGTWQRFERNVAEDYVALFGQEPPRAGKVAVMIDSNDTGSVAEALVAEIRFARRAAERRETPTSMLR